MVTLCSSSRLQGIGEIGNIVVCSNLFCFLSFISNSSVMFICFPFGIEFEVKFKSKFQPSEIAPPSLVSFGAARASNHCLQDVIITTVIKGQTAVLQQI